MTSDSVAPACTSALERLKPKILKMEAVVHDMTDTAWNDWINSLEFDEFLEFIRVAESKESYLETFLEARAEANQAAHI